MTPRKDQRSNSIDISPEQFRKLGHETIDRIADHLSSLTTREITPGESPSQVRKVLGNSGMPNQGTDPGVLLRDTTEMLMEHSLFNGHPNFFGYITSSASPIGAFGDLLAAAVNANVGSFQLAPIATEMEAQTIRWIAEMIGYPTECGGLLVSGGNMANFACFVAGRKAMVEWDVRKFGLGGVQRRSFRIYASTETHTWLQKAVDVCGFGTEAIRWIPTDGKQCMDVQALRRQLTADQESGDVPLMVIGSAGTVSTGAIDPLGAIADVCREYKLWFHVDGAYGGFAAMLPDAPEALKALRHADSVAVDPHKWLYTPLEAGAVLVRDPARLRDAFSYHPPYYQFGSDEVDRPINYYEMGPQNSRGFRALKVWLGLKHIGREGYEKLLTEDIELAHSLFELISDHDEFEAFSHSLSITTFRYVPMDMRSQAHSSMEYLNKLNTELLRRLQKGGEVYLSNAVIEDKFLLRACIVNFRTTLQHIRALPEIVVSTGRVVDQEFRRQ